jgi:16S rRNA U1498 N3-methylase RsmE
MKKNKDGTINMSEKELGSLIATSVKTALAEVRKDGDDTPHAVVKFTAGLIEAATQAGSSTKQKVTDVLTDIKVKGETRMARNAHEEAEAENEAAILEAYRANPTAFSPLLQKK